MYQDLLIKIKNAGMAGKETATSPFSKMDFAIAKILAKQGYLKDAQKKTINRKNFIELKIHYVKNKPALSNVKIMSRPSRHVYFGYRDITSVKNGFGLGVLSTPKGVMTNNEARKSKLGGEYLFQVW